MNARTFRDLGVWRKAHACVVESYRLTAAFPREELFGLTSQLRRAAVSVPANIAEGFVKRGVSDKLRFYNIAQGSLEECRYYMILATDLGYADTVDIQHALDEVSRMLEAYIATIRRSRRKGLLSLLWLLAPALSLFRF
jgi:four helix bundle protein